MCLARSVVELFGSSDRPRAEVATSLGISDGSLATWVQQPERDEVSNALDADERTALARLSKESREVKMGHEFRRSDPSHLGCW